MPGIRRSAIKDTSLPTGGGEKGDQPIFIPAGTDVIASQWATHRREDLYGPDADMFVPERWESLDPGWAYFPFGGGQRACLGRESPTVPCQLSAQGADATSQSTLR